MRVRMLLVPVVAAVLAGGPVRALEPPADLPRYDLDIKLDTDAHTVNVRERVTWTNRHQRPAAELVFNVYAYYRPTKGDIPILAKTVELLRQDPSAAVDPVGRVGDVNSVTCHGVPLATYHEQKPETALVVT